MLHSTYFTIRDWKYNFCNKYMMLYFSYIQGYYLIIIISLKCTIIYLQIPLLLHSIVI